MHVFAASIAGDKKKNTKDGNKPLWIEMAVGGGGHSTAALTPCVANVDDATMPGQSSGPISVCVVSKSPLLEPWRSRYQESSTGYLFSVETHKNASRVGPMQPAETQFVLIYMCSIFTIDRARSLRQKQGTNRRH